MSTLALPICELIPVVDEAKERTKCVVVCSQAERADTVTLWLIARKTLGLRHQLAHLTRRQENLINKLLERDFSTVPVEDMRSIATSIDRLVADERDLLRCVHQLGSELRVWWNTSLEKLSTQVEHLDSIGESLHVASDDEASALLGIAVQQVAAASRQSPLVGRRAVAMK
jgi:hypothetical protein